MKHSIHVNQKQAIELGITHINQAHILDLLTGASTWATPEIIDESVYYWVSRQRISAELPLLGLKPDTVYRHLKSLADIGLIDYIKRGKKDCVKLTKKGRSYYVGFKSEFNEIPMSDSNPNNAENSDSNPNPYVGNKSEKNSDSNPTYQSTNNISLKDDQSKKDAPAKKFTPPDELEVESYANDNGLNLIGFFDYYESNGWMVGKNKMKNWQAAARNWHKRQKQFNPTPQRQSVSEHNQQAAAEARQRILSRGNGNA